MTFNWRTILASALVIAASVEMVEVIKRYRMGQTDKAGITGAAIGMAIVIIGAAYLIKTARKKRRF